MIPWRAQRLTPYGRDMLRIALVVLVLASCRHGDAPPSAPTSAPAAAITRAGVGRLGRLEWWAQKEAATAQKIQQALADLPGITVTFEVLDVPGEVEREEGYWRVARGDVLLAQVLRNEHETGKAPAAVIVWTAELATADGVRVGDRIGKVLAKHAHLRCENTPGGLIADAVAADITCRSAREPEIIYILDATKQKVPAGALAPRSIEAIEIVGIAHAP
jgi:hypothetical protein